MHLNDGWAAAGRTVPRHGLRALLDEASGRRLLTVVAAFGQPTRCLVGRDARAVPDVRGRVPAGDLHAHPADASAGRLIEGWVRVASPAPRLGSSPAAVPFELDRLREQGRVLELGALPPAFPATETSRPRRLQRAPRAHGPLSACLADGILAAEPAVVQRLLTAVTGLPLERSGIAELTRRTRTWFASVEEDRAALSCYLATDSCYLATDMVDAARILAEGGHRAIDRDRDLAEQVVAVSTALPSGLRTAATDQLEGAARQVLGDWRGAERCFDRIAAAVGGLQVDIAWRSGLVRRAWSTPAAAVATDRRGRINGVSPADEAPDRAGHHLGAQHAEPAPDLPQAVRNHIDRGSRHLADGDYLRGLGELDVALDLADRSGFAILRAQAHVGRGEALLGLGRLDEAIAEVETARTLYQRSEPREVSRTLAVLGEVHRERGDLAMARVCWEEVVTTAGEGAGSPALVSSLAGLARVLAPEEPERAAELATMARQAVAATSQSVPSPTLLALAWVTLQAGDKAGAATVAREAAVDRRQRGDWAGLADALELLAAASGGDVLHEVLTLRTQLGDATGQARAQLMLAQRVAGRRGRHLALRAYEQFRMAGAARHAVTALAISKSAGQPVVRVECLGGFRVLRAGRPVQAAEWPAGWARDLLKLLVARRCRPVARADILHSLWPGVEAAAAPAWLSAALTDLRSVLDPRQEFAVDRFIGADEATIWLDGHQAVVDVEEFLRDARAGLAAPDLALLRAAEATYSGDFLAADADWAGGLREEARAVYLRVAWFLAERAGDGADAGADAGAGAEPDVDHDSAVRYLLRILRCDPYDERAHLALVSALLARCGPGEARRAYGRYLQRMGERGIQPASFPAFPGPTGVLPRLPSPGGDARRGAAGTVGG